MRLLNVDTKRLEEFGEEVPHYAILSHTWGPKEVTFKDVEKKGYKSGSKKIDGCCRQAADDGFQYIWVDTCCIDKSSSAELSEAINSMWSWYSKAAICYAYLSDVPRGDKVEEKNSAFRGSRWFTRGWTLQEMLAPGRVCFYNKAWEFLGRKVPDRFIFRVTLSAEDDRFMSILSQITGIPDKFLKAPILRDASVAQKMSWAAGRTTSRIEDVAYSLLGIFNVNMSMLYGEGRRAFVRLQEEIMKSSDDESIFSWGFSPDREVYHDALLLASSPADFAMCGNLQPYTPAGVKSSHYSLTNKGLHIEISICDILGTGTSVGRLNCSSFDDKDLRSIALPLIRSSKGESTFFRPTGSAPVLVRSGLFPDTAKARVYLHRSYADEHIYLRSGFRIKLWRFGEETTFTIYEIYPPAWRSILCNDWLIVQQESLETEQQTIIFLCESVDWPDFAVRIDYKFKKEGFRLEPQGLDCSTAFIEEGKTLAESLIEAKRSGMVDWQRSLEFEDAELILQVDYDYPKLGYELASELWTLNVTINKKHGHQAKLLA